MENTPEIPRDLAAFYGINEEFPWDNLYYRHDTVKQNVVLLNDGLNIAMKSTKKYKLEVINLGLKMFERNRDKKTDITHRLL
jgi:hypothetical protein